MQLILSKPCLFGWLSLYHRVGHSQFPEVRDPVEGDVISIMLVMRPSGFPDLCRGSTALDKVQYCFDTLS